MAYPEVSQNACDRSDQLEGANRNSRRPAKKYRLKEGTVVAFREEKGHLVLEPDPFDALLALYGSLKAHDLEKILVEERRKEREREDRREALYSRR